MSSSASALKLLDLIQSHRVTAVIYVAAKLGIADLLADGPKSLDEIVQATGADRAALARLLAALVDHRHLHAGRTRSLCAGRNGHSTGR